jgi:tetratricopeptide (TPR) repeat protein
MLFDNLLESGLYSYGIGITAFAILGLGLVQSADGITPEFVPKAFRATAAVLGFLIGIVLLHAATVETLRARTRYLVSLGISHGIGSPLSQQDFADANAIIDAAMSIAPFDIDKCDGENWRLKADLASNIFQRINYQKEAVKFEPNTRNYRALGISQMMVPDPGPAIVNFNHALEEDPNNLLTLPPLRNAYVAYGDMTKALETAQRTIDVEKSPYFQVRSLPQLIPVETYEARAFLAEHTEDLNKRADLLEQALAGYQLYYKTTVPLMLQMVTADPSVQYGGENMTTMRLKMRAATAYAKELADTYKKLGNKAGEGRALQMQQQYQRAIPGPQPT